MSASISATQPNSGHGSRPSSRRCARSSQPIGHGVLAAVVHVVAGHPGGGAGGPARVVLGAVGPVGPLARLEVQLLVAQPPGGPGQTLLGAPAALVSSARWKLLAGQVPLPAAEGLGAAGQRVFHHLGHEPILPRPPRPGQLREYGVVHAITWLGHSTVLIEAGGARLLTDPVLRPRVAHLTRARRPWTRAT